MDENVVQPGVVQPGESQEGITSKEQVDNKQVAGEKQSEENQQAQPQSLTQEQIQKMISDSIAPVLENAKREIQSIKDKSRAEVETAYKKAAVPERILSQLRTRVQDESPELAKEIEMAELRAKVEHYQGSEVASQTQAHQAMFDQQFRDQMNQFITASGVDPKDKRVDWGDDATDYLAKQNRILTSVSKVLKAREDDIKKSIEQQVKDAETKLRKELGLDSVDTSNPPPKSNIPDNKKTADDWIGEGLKESTNKRRK